MERKWPAGPKSDGRKRYGSGIDPDEEALFAGQPGTGLTTAQAIAKYRISNKLEAFGPTQILQSYNCKIPVKCLTYTEAYDMIAAGYDNGEVKLHSLESLEPVNVLLEEGTNGSPVTAITHRPVCKEHPVTNTLIATYLNGFVNCFNYNFQACLFTIKENRKTYGVAYHLRLPKFVTFGDDKRIFLYDEETRTQERIFSATEKSEVDGHENSVFAACFNPRSNNELITGGIDGYVIYWDVRQPNAVKYLSGMNIVGNGIDINARGTEILICAWQRDNPLQLYEYETGNFLKAIHPDQFSKSLQICGKFLSKDCCVTGGEDPNIFRLLDVKTSETVAYINGLPGPICDIDIGPEKKKVIELEKSRKKRYDVGEFSQVAIACGKGIFQIDFGEF